MITAHATRRSAVSATTSPPRARPNLPLVIHSREADDDDLARILEEETGKGAFPAVLHCFTGSRELAERAIALGLFISFTGILTFKKSDDLRSIAKSLPAGRVLVETDHSPLFGRYRGKRNEPAYVTETAQVLAETRGVSLDEIARGPMRASSACSPRCRVRRPTPNKFMVVPA